MAKSKADIQRELEQKLKELEKKNKEIDSLKKDAKRNYLSPQETLELSVPGLPAFSPETSKSMIPQFKESEFVIKDPLNPQLPTVTIAQYDIASENYKGANRALDIYGMSFDTTSKMFSVIGKRAKAVGSGIDAATETEKTRHSFVNYQHQLQTNQQAAIALDVTAHKTAIDAQTAVFTKTLMDYSLEEAETKTRLTLDKLTETKGKAALFRESLGKYIEAKAK